MNTVKSVSSEHFATAVIAASRSRPVLVDFWAPWCGPCQALGPTLEKAAAEFADSLTVLKLNTDEEPQIAGQYAIRSIPAAKLFRDGKVVAEFVGAQPLSAVRQFLTQHIGKSGPTADAAPAEEPAWVQAEKLARRGQFDSAKKMLDALPPGAQADAPVKTARAALHFAHLLHNPDETDLVQSARVRAARLLLAGSVEAGLDELLQVMQRNRRFATGQGRDDLLQAFCLAPADSAAVASARRRLAALLN